MNQTTGLPAINIAIDGFSACGKSTLAKDLASRLSYRHIDSGSMYRAITYYFLQHQVDHMDPQAVLASLAKIQLDFEARDGRSVPLLNGVVLQEEIRTRAVDAQVSTIAAIAEVRTQVVAQQQEIGRAGGIVMDGRDIGTVVFPSAALKLFVKADLEVRVSRRLEELKGSGFQIDRETVRANLQHRDRIDSTRVHSPLYQAADAVVLDNSNLSIAEQMEMVYALAQCRMRQR